MLYLEATKDTAYTNSLYTDDDISLDYVQGAQKQMKIHKPVGADGIMIELLKYGGWV